MIDINFNLIIGLIIGVGLALIIFEVIIKPLMEKWL